MRSIQGWQEDRQPRAIGLGYFVSQTAGKSIQKTLLVPFIFMALNWTGTTFLSSTSADTITVFLSYGIPSLQQHYSVLETLGRIEEARNYALFYAIMVIATAAIVLKTCIIYFFVRLRFLTPGKNETILIVLGIMGAVVIGLGLDRAHTEPGSLFHLRFDQIGFYYIRQWCLFAFFQFTLTLMTIALFSVLQPRSVEVGK